MKRLMTLVLFGAGLMVGCDTDMTPGDGGDDGMNGGGAGTTLDAITFSPSSGFAQDQDPVEFTVGDGSITTTGGTAGTQGQLGLYADDLFAWDFDAGNSGSITFNDLEVIAVDGYWVHPNGQSAGATMTAVFSGGGFSAVASAPVVAFGRPGQSAGFFDTINAPDGETITELTFEFDAGSSDGDVAALDVLELTVQ